MLKSFMPKTYLTEMENSAFAEHQLMYMNRQTEDLSASVRNFGRYVIESLKPLGSVLQSPWFWIVIILLVGILVIIFLPGIFDAASGAVASTTEAVNSGPVITPR